MPIFLLVIRSNSSMKDTLDLATGRGDKINFTKMMDIRDDDF